MDGLFHTVATLLETCECFPTQASTQRLDAVGATWNRKSYEIVSVSAVEVVANCHGDVTAT